MDVEVVWTPGEARDLDTAGRRLVVVDVLRATGIIARAAPPVFAGARNHPAAPAVIRVSAADSSTYLRRG